MVLKVNSTNQKQLAAYARDVFHAYLLATAKDGALIQMQHSFHHIDTICHPNSSYVTTKMYGMSTCGCNNNTVIQ